MKDLDFDELDRAVNSLMSGVPKDTSTQKRETDEPVIELKPQGDMSKAPESFSTPVSVAPNAQRSLRQPQPHSQETKSASEPAKSSSSAHSEEPSLPPANPTPRPSESQSPASSIPDESTEDSDSPSEDIAVSANAPVDEVHENATPESEPSRNTPMTISSSLPARRAGRFMDMVHPSADMKRPEPTAKPSRSGVTIAPRDTFASTETSEVAELPSEDDAKLDQILPQQPISPLAALTGVDAPSTESMEKKAASLPASSPEPQAKTEWPDPLDMAGFDEDSLDQSLKNVAKDDAPLTSGALDLNSAPKTRDSDVSSAQAPSPFLPDTKVEKRPLGGLNAEEPDHTPVRANANDDQTYGRSDPDAQLPPANSAADAPLPAELHSDLVAIEADSGPADQPVPQPTLATATKPSAQPTQAQSATDAVKPSQKTSSVLGAALPKDASSAQSGPTSIPKQYREEPSTSDENSGSIYDTDSYHQPLDHPPKKKSGWMWVLWILLILLVGAAGGAGIYFMGML